MHVNVSNASGEPPAVDAALPIIDAADITSAASSAGLLPTVGEAAVASDNGNITPRPTADSEDASDKGDTTPKSPAKRQVPITSVTAAKAAKAGAASSPAKGKKGKGKGKS